MAGLMRMHAQLGAIHDHLNNNAMDRITWIIIWSAQLCLFPTAGDLTPPHLTGSSS